MIGRGTGSPRPGPRLPDLTPLVDVVFLILVFLLLSIHTLERALEVELPAKGSDQARPLAHSAVLTLSLSADGRWRVDGRPYSRWEAVEEAILERRRRDPAVAVVIRGDRRAALEHLLQALAFLRRQGIASVDILMQTSPVSPTTEQ